MKVKLCEKFLVHSIDEDDERFQARLDYDSKEIERLANDIAQFGQRSPIGVRRSPEKKDEYQLIYGFQRFKAIKILRNETIKTYVYEEITNEECEEIGISDNITHGDLTEMHACKLLWNPLKRDWRAGSSNIEMIVMIRRSFPIFFDNSLKRSKYEPYRQQWETPLCLAHFPIGEAPFHYVKIFQDE